jgi:hypothetical protein
VPWLRLVVAYLLIAEARVRSQSVQCGIFVETQWNWDRFFFEYFRFSWRCNSISAAHSSLFMHNSYEKDKWAKPGVHLLRCAISGMSREVDENWAVLGYYAASNVNSNYNFARGFVWV